MEVRDGRQAIVEVGVFEKFAATADMEDDRQAGLLGDGPQRIEADVAGE